MPDIPDNGLHAWSLAFGAIGSFLVMAAGKVVGWWIDIGKSKQAAQLAANDQAVLFYKSLVEALQKKANELEARLEVVEKQHRDCMEANIKLEAKIQVLEDTMNKKV